LFAAQVWWGSVGDDGLRRSIGSGRCHKQVPALTVSAGGCAICYSSGFGLSGHPMCAVTRLARSRAIRLPRLRRTLIVDWNCVGTGGTLKLAPPGHRAGIALTAARDCLSPPVVARRLPPRVYGLHGLKWRHMVSQLNLSRCTVPGMVLSLCGLGQSRSVGADSGAGEAEDFASWLALSVRQRPIFRHTIHVLVRADDC